MQTVEAAQRRGAAPHRPKKKKGEKKQSPMQNAHDANIEGSVLGKNPIDCQCRHNYQQLRGLVPGLPTIPVVEGVSRVGMLENVGGTQAVTSQKLNEIAVIGDSDYGRQNELPDQN